MPETQFPRFVKFVENYVFIALVQEAPILGLGELRFDSGEVNTKNGEFNNFQVSAGEWISLLIRPLNGI